MPSLSRPWLPSLMNAGPTEPKVTSSMCRQMPLVSVSCEYGFDVELTLLPLVGSLVMSCDRLFPVVDEGLRLMFSEDDMVAL